jgi:hypothetical protein
MVAYGRIGAKVWKATSNLTAFDDAETLAFLDFQVRQWRESIPPELQLDPGDQNMLDGHSRTSNRLRVLLYLRANQMRLLIFRRALMSPQKISNDLRGARQAVDTSKDTIRVLDRLNKSTDIYSSQQTSFNYFLVSALATMLLAVCHATTQFNQSCREEFYLGLELVRGFSSNSHVARRLWRTVKHLKVVGPRLGVLPNQEQSRNRSRDSHGANLPRQASTLGHLAPVVEHDLGACYVPNMTFDAEISPAYSFSLDGKRLSNDLTNLFEAIDPNFSQQPLPDSDIHGDFGFYDYGTTDGLTRSLMNLM